MRKQPVERPQWRMVCVQFLLFGVAFVLGDVLLGQEGRWSGSWRTLSLVAGFALSGIGGAGVGGLVESGQ
ncbi:MAG: hypothetical protein R3D55_26425 [Chloroflexota bacterium]